MSGSFSKRRLINLLPAFNRTADLTAFFGATVDEVFQPGTAEPLAGYIGRQISGTDNFYVAEPNAARAFYQLEPGMTSYDPVATSTVDYALVYPHLVSYLATNGADVSNQQRLFETPYYSWAPPINFDMLINYNQYYWFGDIDTTNLYSFNGNDQTSAITLANGQLTAQWNVNTGGSGTQAVRSTAMTNGSWYIEFTLTTVIDGQQCGLSNSIDPIDQSPGQLNSGNNAIVYTSDGQVFNDSGAAIATIAPFTSEQAIVGVAWNTVSKKIWFRLNGGAWNNASDNPSVNVGGFDLTALLSNGPVQAIWLTDAANGQANINFGTTDFDYQPPTGFVGPASVLPSADLPSLILTVPSTAATGNGVDTTFPLPNTINAVPSDQETPAAYVNNVAVTIASIDGNTVTLAAAPPSGTTVLIYRTPDLAAVITGAVTVNISDINTNGVANLTSSMRIKIVDAVHTTDAWDDQPWDVSPWDFSPGALYFVDGVGVSIRLTSDTTMIRGLVAQYVTIDRSSIDRPTNGWALRNSWVHKDSYAWSGAVFPTRQATRPIIEFVRDLTRYPQQTWSESSVPLFMLYDLNGVALNDPTTYPNSTFAGNRLFGYAAGTSFDSVLAMAVSYDSNDYLEFSNDSANQSYSTQNTTINGIFQYSTTNSDHSLSYSAFWHLVTGSTAQTIDSTTGFYNIPLNLQANPDYDEVDLISRSTWTVHFDEIIARQTGLIGNVVGDNNYRDTPRNLTLGSEIVQHVAPLLKTMLLAATAPFDFGESVRYVELEYNRFRNKFVRKLGDLSNRGILQVTDPPTTWVSTTLAALKVGHTNNFPFALSSMAGGQYFIPSTATALGLLPAAVPTMLVYPESTFILGHDGSLTPAFGDWRDAVLLALESQIYQNLPAQFQTDARPVFDIHYWIGNKFFVAANGYSNAETTAIMAPMFELWAQTNNLDYRTHDDYDANNPFTWNYRGMLDQFGNVLPGNWRAIYQFYYDTTVPHLRPWEMLGFVSQPSWWQDTYGSAPYVRSNTALWTDLTNGMIQGGNRAGIDPRYARPGLTNLIPVDDDGNLLDPVAIGIVGITVSYQLGTRDWIAGDIGPVENLWRHSPAYRFSLMQASFLMKPARFVETGWDVLKIGYVADQWVMLDSLVRPRNALQYVHGEINPDLTLDAAGVPLAVTGISQWVCDYLLSCGSTNSVLGTAVRGLQVNLIHQMAGFTPADTLQLAADSFGVLPTEDVQTILYTSPAIRSEVYSGVIIEWTGNAWRMIGYDGRDPFFTVIPPNTTGQKGLIALAGASEPTIVPWRAGTYYPLQILVSYLNSVYQCTTANISTTIFEQSYWQPRPDLSTNMIQSPRVVTYTTGLPTTVRVPYGTEYTTYQDVANFLLGWERWLVSRGWSFTNLDPTSNGVLNWSLSVEEFLSWAQIQWAPGNFIALSPGQARLNFTAVQGTIIDVENNTTGFYGLADRSGRPIGQRNAIISRLDGAIVLAANNADIFLARLEICNIEHALITSNTTIFGDVIYLPLYNLRQQRLGLTCNRATNWAGRFDAPGFIITDNTLASSFEKAANDVRLMFDIEHADVPTLRNYARHDVGMQERTYFNNLLVSSNNQFEFYQGMIQEKGTPGVFAKLTRSTVVSSPTSTLQFLEEWAFRDGVFGAPSPPFVTFQLSQDDLRDDPQFVSFGVQANAPLDWIELTSNDSRWYDRPAAPTNFFPQRSDYTAAVLPTAGPVRLTDVQNTVFALTDVATLYDPNTNNLPTGSSIWVYDGLSNPLGTTWYVNAVTGDDGNLGSALAAPFASLQQAHDVSNPGDVIVVAGGLTALGQPISYTAPMGTNVLEITRSGTVAAPIIYQAAAGSRPVIIGTQSAAAVHFNAVSYVEMQGFEIIGWNDTLTLSSVRGATINGSTLPIYNGSGIVIDQGFGIALSHHVTIERCWIHDFPNNGILVDWSDYITIKTCKVYSNALYSPLAGSGINIMNSHDIDSNISYKTSVLQNTCFDNINLITNEATGTFSDGSGIVIADNQNTTTDNAAYNGRTLIANNLCYNNGGNGILLVTSSYVDTIYNTTYQNQTNTNRNVGEIVTIASTDCNICNNIMSALPAMPLALPSGSAITYLNNLGYGGNGQTMPGVSSFNDPLFANPAAGQFNILQGSVAINAASRTFVTATDILGNQRSGKTGYDIGCYQTKAAPSEIIGKHAFDVLTAFDIGPNSAFGAQVNVIQTVVVPGVTASPTVDPTLVTTRIYFALPMTVTINDVNNYLIIDGLAQTAPELEGLQVITNVDIALNAVDIQTICTTGNDFSATPTIAPTVRVLRSMRFVTMAAIDPNYIFTEGDQIWIDDYDPTTAPRWAVLQYTNGGWSVIRQQPYRIATRSVSETVIYRADAQIIGQQMILNQPVLPDIDVIDPLAGLICGVSAREINYRNEYDPANYNAGYGDINSNIWGATQVGQVWWDLATVRFLDPYTDTLGMSDARDLTELQYRIGNWAHVAPQSSVDIYEWTVSSVDPITYSATATLPGTVYNATAPSWVEVDVYNPTLHQSQTLYYFWVTGLTTVPDMVFRHISITDVATGINNPSLINAWMSPISPAGLVVSGIASVLDNTTTVMKVGLQVGDTAGRNDQWALLRPGDETSLPSTQLWTNMQNGLAGFAVVDAVSHAVPDPSLPIARNTGIFPGQSMFQMSASPIAAWLPSHVYYYGDLVALAGVAFQCVSAGTSGGSGPSGYSSTITDGTVLWSYHGTDGSRSGLFDARSAFIGSINTIFAATPMWLERTVALENVINRVTPYATLLPTGAYLSWIQTDASYAYDPPPANEWDSPFEVYSLSGRNDLLANQAFQLSSLPEWSTSTNYLVGNRVINAGNAYLCVASGLSGATAPTGTSEISDGGVSWLWLAALVNGGGPISVLVSGYANPIPQWSIWVFDPNNARTIVAANPYIDPTQQAAWMISTLISNADQMFSLKTAYEFSVTSDAAKNALTLQNLQRVLVTSDVDNFWAIYQWQQPNPLQSGTFVLWRAQTYATRDFITTTDWFDTATLIANNYSPSEPPIVTYATETQRDAIEGTPPTNYFVAITNSNQGNDSFIWTLYRNGAWQIVAIGNGTIALSSQFINPSNVIYAISTVTDPQPITLANIPIRDGSWEMRILVQAVRYSGLLLDIDINQVWFDMVNFVHVQQNEVDWAFKTSFLDVLGVNVPLVENPVKTVDQTANIADYINEVKPYRVKIRETVTQYSPPIDVGDVTATDFDMPLYFDPTTKTYRVLDPNDSADQTILATAPWQAWYDNYLANPSLIRSFDITLLFDRIATGLGNWDMSGWDTAPWDVGEVNPGAAYRIVTYYQPTAGMPPLDLTNLLNLASQFDQNDGGTFSPESYDRDVNPNDGFATTPDTDFNPPLPSQPGGYDLRAPYEAANHPQERVPFIADDQLQLVVTTQSSAGALPQISKLFNVGAVLIADPAATTTTVFYDLIAQSAAAVMVFCDGARAVLGTDYTVDVLNSSITLNLTVNGQPVQWALIHPFGFGGTAPIIEQDYLTYGTDALTLNNPTAIGNLAVIVNGVWLAAGQYGLTDGTAVTLTSPPGDGSDVILLVYGISAATATILQSQTMTYTSGSQTWGLTYPDTITVPPHVATIVEVNGKRLTPPQTFYGEMNPAKRWIYLPVMPSSAAIQVFYYGESETAIANATGAATVTATSGNGPAATAQAHASGQTTVTGHAGTWVRYDYTIPTCVSAAGFNNGYPFDLVVPEGETPPTDIAGQFVLYDNLLVALDPAFVSRNIVIVLTNSSYDYTVSASELTITSDLTSGDVITVTTFSNANAMQIKTVTFNNDSGQYILPQPKPDLNYALVTMNGNALSLGNDYDIYQVPYSDNNVSFMTSSLVLTGPVTGPVVATVFTGSIARPETMWQTTTKTLAAVRMTPLVINTSPNPRHLHGFDANPMDSEGFDLGYIAPLSDQFSLLHAFETICLNPYMAGTLVADLGVDDSSFSVTLFEQTISDKMQTADPLPLPNGNKPGVVWIGNERIEYFGYSRTDNVVTLSALRRATRGTSMGMIRQVLTAYVSGSGEIDYTYSFAKTGEISDVTVNGVQQPPTNFTVDGNQITITGISHVGHPHGGNTSRYYLVIGMIVPASHFAGTTVYNGLQIVDETPSLQHVW